jgi:hypothetical protein
VNKLAIALASAALAVLAAPAAHASPALCVDFVNFCDGLQIRIDNDAHTISGSWRNWDCAGTDEPIVGGVRSLTEYRVYCTTAGCPLSYLWVFVLDAFQAGFTFDLFGSDGINPPFLQQLDQPYTVSAGACAFSGTEKGPLPTWWLR